MYFGVEDLSESYVAGALIIDGVLKIVLHPFIKIEVPRSADIVIIFLQSPIYTTNLISPVCLSKPGDNHKNTGKVGYAVGWGINEAGFVSSFKKHSAMTITNQNACHKSFPNINFNKNSYFCASSIDTFSTPCELDDPFYVKELEKWYLIGLINVYFFNPVENKCSLTSPTLYEDISFYTDWIKASTK